MSQRKDDHIKLAGQSAPQTHDQRFLSEPRLGMHPEEQMPFNFLGKTMKQPLWISSMTGGTKLAEKVNYLLAEACAEFGLGMGLGSCRALLDRYDHLSDFDLRHIMGNEVPFFANIGIVQLEKLFDEKAFGKIEERIIDKLNVDGLIVHVNPTQEYLQPEGDQQKRPALETIEAFLSHVGNRYPVVVKEVGQGMGIESIDKLTDLPIDGIEFGAFGGTNFATIELIRNQNGPYKHLYPLASVGHTPDEMLNWLNRKEPYLTKREKPLNLIVSGGIRNFLDGYYFLSKSKYPAVYGMANAILQQALKSRQELFDFIQAEKMGFDYARNFLKVNN
jgi:isopentenyl-diphosphate delta-isomerase